VLFFTPLVFLQDQWDLRQEKRSLAKKIAKIDINPANFDVPATKTLYGLWQLHGLNANSHPDESRKLLSEWIEILYGKKVLESLDFDQRLEDILATHARMNRPYYEGDSEAPYFVFMPPVRCLIKELSKELGEYGG